jgi:hypothetical protein
VGVALDGDDGAATGGYFLDVGEGRPATDAGVVYCKLTVIDGALMM